MLDKIVKNMRGLFVIVLISISCSMFAQAQKKQIPEVIPVKEYQQTWKENELKAENLYKGKTVVLSGKIFGIGRRMISDIPYVDLDVDFFDGFCCEFSEKDLEELYKLKKGQQIIIVGTGESGWTLKKCAIYKK